MFGSQYADEYAEARCACGGILQHPQLIANAASEALPSFARRVAQKYRVPSIVLAQGFQERVDSGIVAL